MRVPALLVAALLCADAYVPSPHHQTSRHASPRRSLRLSSFSGGNNNNNSNRNRVSDFGKTTQQIGTGIGNSGQYGGGFDNYSGNGGGYGMGDGDGYGFNSVTSSQQFKSDQFLQHVSDFCIGCNEFWKSLVVPQMIDWLETRPGGTALSNPLSKIQAGPEYPGISRPVWLVMAGSFATLFNWFGYYKFVVEEELVSNLFVCYILCVLLQHFPCMYFLSCVPMCSLLNFALRLPHTCAFSTCLHLLRFQYQYELQTTGRVTTCGGYGTFVAYVCGVFIGWPLIWAHIPGGEFILTSAVVWLALSQVNLYRRVNELTQESRDVLGLEGDGRMLHEWWALLPPPMNLVVGLRQIYFLSEYWRVIRGDPPATDYVAEDWLPFVAERRRFSLEELWTGQVPWFWFMKDDFQNPFNRNDNGRMF